jgi:hypothetical protein
VKWRPTPEKQRITARKFVGDAWIDCRMEDLQPGDIFRAVAPGGDLVDPCTNEPDEDAVALVIDWPIKNYNNQIGSLLGARGYGVPIDLFPSMDELKRKGLS